MPKRSIGITQCLHLDLPRYEPMLHARSKIFPHDLAKLDGTRLGYFGRLALLAAFLPLNAQLATADDYCDPNNSDACATQLAELSIIQIDAGERRKVALQPGKWRVTFEFQTDEGILRPEIDTSNHNCSIQTATVLGMVPGIDNELVAGQGTESRMSVAVRAKGMNWYVDPDDIRNITDTDTSIALSAGPATLVVDVNNWDDNDDCLLSVQLHYNRRTHTAFDATVLATHIRNRIRQMDSASLIRLPYVRVVGFPRVNPPIRDIYYQQLNGCQDFMNRQEAKDDNIGLSRRRIPNIDQRLREFLVALGLSPAIELSTLGALDEILHYDHTGSTSLFQAGSAFPFIYSCRANLEELRKLGERLGAGEAPRLAIYTPTVLPAGEVPDWLEGTTLDFALPALALDMLQWLPEYGIDDPREVVFVFRTGGSCRNAEYLVIFDEDGRSLVSALHKAACGESSATISLPLGPSSTALRPARVGVSLEGADPGATSINLPELLHAELSTQVGRGAELRWGFKLSDFVELDVVGAKGLALKDRNFWEKLGLYAQVREAHGNLQLLLRVEGFYTPGIGDKPPMDASTYEISMDVEYFKEISEFAEELAHRLASNISQSKK